MKRLIFRLFRAIALFYLEGRLEACDLALRTKGLSCMERSVILNLRKHVELVVQDLKEEIEHEKQKAQAASRAN